MSAVHVAVDAHNLVRDDRGIGRYARAVLAPRGARAGLPLDAGGARSLPAPRARCWPPSAPSRGAPVAVARRVPADAGVVWFPWNGTFLRSAAPAVATVHDAAPFAFPHPDPKVRATEQGPFLLTAATRAADPRAVALHRAPR